MSAPGSLDAPLSQMGVSTVSRIADDQRPGRVIVVRHAATAWSKTRRHTGRTDIPLEPDGEAEALELSVRLAELRPAVVLSSPLSRAFDTCVLAGFGDGAERTDLLLEMDYGEYEGLTTAQIREARPSWDLFRDGCPGGETIEDVARRADALAEELRDERLKGADVLVFSHGHLLRVLAARWLRLPATEARRLALGAGRIGILGWEHDWTVLAGWNL